MTFTTDEKLKSYLDSNQMHREQMCRSVLAADKRFTEVKPRHPRGGRDGGRDIEATYRENELVFGAVGFMNQANDSNEHKRTIKNKFSSDLDSAIDSGMDVTVFVFFTNINLTVTEKDNLIAKAKNKGINYCDIIDRERIRIVLDSTDGFSIRFQFLNIPLSEEEQASFFSKWGDDIQSVISSGFQKVEHALNRVIFLQEAKDPLNNLSMSFELDKKYDAEEIGHFRVFCDLTLKEPKHNILSILFGSFDKSNRVRMAETPFTEQTPGIKYGIGFGQWEEYLENDQEQESVDNIAEWSNCESGSSVGRDEVEFLTIVFSKSSFIRLEPVFSLSDLDDAMFLPFLNKSFAEKVKAIHIYSNGYKLKEIHSSDINIDNSSIEPCFPVDFDNVELQDQWVRIRPNKESNHHLRFYENTPKKMFVSHQVKNSLEK